MELVIRTKTIVRALIIAVLLLTLAGLAAMNVSDWNAEQQRGLRRRQRLVTVAEHH